MPKDDITHQQILDKIDAGNQQLRKEFMKAIGASQQRLIDAMTQQMGVIVDNMVTKKDLQEAKEELRDELLGEIKSFRDELKSDIMGIKDDVRGLKVDAYDVKRDIKALKVAVAI